MQYKLTLSLQKIINLFDFMVPLILNVWTKIVLNSYGTTYGD